MGHADGITSSLGQEPSKVRYGGNRLVVTFDVAATSSEDGHSSWISRWRQYHRASCPLCQEVNRNQHPQ
jgi:hypothetical protein